MRALGIITIGTICLAATTGRGELAESFACLNEAQQVETLNGTLRDVRVEIGPDQAIDARGARIEIHEAELTPAPERVVNENNGIRVLDRGHAGGCWAGGTVAGDFERCASWRSVKRLDHAAISIGNTGFKVQGLHIKNVEDAIRVHDGADLSVASSPPDTRFFAADGFEVSDVWAEYIRDDCIENDAYAGGVVRDSLFDGCNTGISQTPGMRLRQIAPGDEPEARRLRDALDGTDKTVTLERVLLRMQLFPHPNRPEKQWVQQDGVVYGGGALFKIRDRSPRFVIRNSVFAFDGQTKGRFSFPELQGCANNTIVWLGGGSFPGDYPEHCFTLTTDPEAWRSAVRAWHARHPEVGADAKPAPDAMGDASLVRCE